MPRGQPLSEGFREATRIVLASHDGNISRAARQLGISRDAVRNSIKARVSRKRGRPPIVTDQVVADVLQIVDEDEDAKDVSEIRDKLWETKYTWLSETTRRILANNIITRKKIDKHAIERDTPYNIELTKEYLARVCGHFFLSSSHLFHLSTSFILFNSCHFCSLTVFSLYTYNIVVAFIIICTFIMVLFIIMFFF